MNAHFFSSGWRWNWRELAHRARAWLPSRGNVVFTLLVAVGLLGVGKVGAVPFKAPAAASTSVNTIIYQGRLTDASGVPLNGTYVMIFRLYSAATGGSPLWEEYRTGGDSVLVTRGLFTVHLGSVTPLPAAIMTGNSDLWLGITVGTDAEMTPRVQLGSVPYAFHAVHADDGVPSGAIIIWDQSGTCPTGYARVTAIDNRFTVGAGATYGSAPQVTGGTAHHTHTFTTSTNGSHTHTMSGSGEDEPKAHNECCSRPAPANHVHTIYASGDHAHTGTTTQSDPPFYTVLYCRKN